MPAPSVQENFDPIQSRIVRKALKERDKSKAKTKKELRDIERTTALIPSLKEALVELVNASIRSVHEQEGGGIYSPRADHHFDYRIPVGEGEDPVRVTLDTVGTNIASGPSIAGIDSFTIDVSDYSRTLTTRTRNIGYVSLSRHGLTVLHKYKINPGSNDRVSRPAKANDITDHRDLARLLTLGVVNGTVFVKRM